MHHSLSVLFIYDESKNFHSKTNSKSSHQHIEASIIASRTEKSALTYFLTKQCSQFLELTSSILKESFKKYSE